MELAARQHTRALRVRAPLAFSRRLGYRGNPAGNWRPRDVSPPRKDAADLPSRRHRRPAPRSSESQPPMSSSTVRSLAVVISWAELLPIRLVAALEASYKARQLARTQRWNTVQ